MLNKQFYKSETVKYNDLSLRQRKEVQQWIAEIEERELSEIIVEAKFGNWIDDEYRIEIIGDRVVNVERKI